MVESIIESYTFNKIKNSVYSPKVNIKDYYVEIKTMKIIAEVEITYFNDNGYKETSYLEIPIINLKEHLSNEK